MRRYATSNHFVAAAFLIPVAASEVSFGDDYSWLGGSSQSWTDPNNWADPQHETAMGYPTGGDVVYFSSGATVSLKGGQSAQTVNISD
jgi:hypothetical protein